MYQPYRSRLFWWAVLANGAMWASGLLIASGHVEIARRPFFAELATPAPPAQDSKPTLLFSETELTGKYYFGDGLGVICSLELSGNHRFDFRWHGCLGEYDRNQGAWALDG